MIIDVKNISMKQFNRLNNYPCSDTPTPLTHAYISITGCGLGELQKPRIKEALWFAGLKLAFDDVTYALTASTRTYSPVSFYQAKEIVHFVEYLHEQTFPLTLIVHCLAGVSRSAAVAKWVNEALDLKLPTYNRSMYHNEYVYEKLQECWNTKDK